MERIEMSNDSNKNLRTDTSIRCLNKNKEKEEKMAKTVKI